MYDKCRKSSLHVKRLYNYLLEERGLKISTIDGVHTVLHQILNVAVEKNYMRVNIAFTTRLVAAGVSMGVTPKTVTPAAAIPAGTLTRKMNKRTA